MVTSLLYKGEPYKRKTLFVILLFCSKLIHLAPKKKKKCWFNFTLISFLIRLCHLGSILRMEMNL